MQGHGVGRVDSPSVPKLWVVSWKKRARSQRGHTGAKGNSPIPGPVPSGNDPLATNLDEAGVRGGCGADHVDIGSGCGADALERGIGRRGEGKVLGVSVRGAGAGGGVKAGKSLWDERKNKESCPPSPVNVCVDQSHRLLLLLPFVSSRATYWGPAHWQKAF